ncbi:MAG: phage major capsid protein [Acidobacteriaceae bacterium]
MAAKLFELVGQQKFALEKAESILHAAEDAGRDMTATEELEYGASMAAYKALAPEVQKLRAQSTIRNMVGPNGVILVDGGRRVSIPGQREQRVLSQDYSDAFYSYIQSGGTKMEAALYEGAEGSGGYVVPSMVDQQIVPLAPPDEGVRSVAMVIPTVMDVRIPIKGSFGVAGAKAESGAASNTFPETDPTLGQFTLSAFMAGIKETISWELAQDVPNFQSFAVSDMIAAQQIYEGNLYVNGTGTGQAQGLIGNVGAGATAEVADAQGNLLSIAATFDVMGTLKTPYFRNASWLMQRATGVELRKAQAQSNLFAPVFTSVDGRDYLHGFPVVYDGNMPAIAAGATPVLFGDFKQGYVIGDRGGAGVNVKVLDQVQALQGQLVLLAYRRTDGRVRRSEAIQPITLHS